MLWESARVPTAFSSSPELSRGFLIRLKQAEHVFSLFLKVEKIPRRKKGNNLFTSGSSKCKFSFLAPSLHQQLALVLCFALEILS